MMKASRTPAIMADAAYAMLCRDPTKFTANFCIDEEVQCKFLFSIFFSPDSGIHNVRMIKQDYISVPIQLFRITCSMTFCQVVTEEGITDLDQYHNCPGTPLVPDFFLGDNYPVPEGYSADSVSENIRIHPWKYS